MAGRISGRYGTLLRSSIEARLRRVGAAQYLLLYHVLVLYVAPANRGQRRYAYFTVLVIDNKDTYTRTIRLVALAGDEAVVACRAGMSDNTRKEESGNRTIDDQDKNLRAVGSAGGEDDTVGARGLVVARSGGVDGASWHDGEL